MSSAFTVNVLSPPLPATAARATWVTVFAWIVMVVIAFAVPDGAAPRRSS